MRTQVQTSIAERVDAVDWQSAATALHDRGYTTIQNLLTPEDCRSLIAGYDQDGYRKTVNMARYRFGLGEYKYFDYPLPSVVGQLRTSLYTPLSSVANSWNRALRIDQRYPATHAEMLQQCHNAGQLKPTPLVLKYGAGGFNTLHQDLYGSVYFPMQAVFMLSDPETDFTGGELVLVEQVPRAQSKATVIQPGRGDAVVFTTQFRPGRGSKGYYRVHVKHGVSEVTQGHRFTLGIIFHDGES